MAVDPELDLVNHQPDEVCVLVRSTGQVDPRRLYEDVRGALNSDLRRILSQPRPDAWADDEPLANDLAPAALRQRFGRTSDVLQPLERRRHDRAGDQHVRSSHGLAPRRR